MDNQQIITALKWYEEVASAISRYMVEKKTTSLEAAMVELSLDGGKRAATALMHLASLTPPAGESVGEQGGRRQMLARGWHFQLGGGFVSYYKQIGDRQYQIYECGRADIKWAWCVVGTRSTHHATDELTAADACERHAGKEQGK